MSELDTLLNSVENANSKKTYRTTYNKLIGSGKFKSTIAETPNLEIIKIIKGITDNAFNRKTYLTAVIKIKRLADLPISELELYREQHKLDVLQHIKTNNEEPKTWKTTSGVIQNPAELTLKGFSDYVDVLYKAGRYKEYIVNYLILHYGVRSQDIDCIIVTGAKKTAPVDDNSLLVYKTKIEYIRRKYKTFKVYGEKKYTIKDKKFVTAVNALNLENGQPFLDTPDGKRHTSASIAKIVQRLTYREAGEGRLFKLLVDEYKYNEPKMEELSQSRGTSRNEINTSYTKTNLTGEEMEQ
jgi:hypothetical protein